MSRGAWVLVGASRQRSDERRGLALSTVITRGWTRVHEMSSTTNAVIENFEQRRPCDSRSAARDRVNFFATFFAKADMRPRAVKCPRTRALQRTLQWSINRGKRRYFEAACGLL